MVDPEIESNEHLSNCLMINKVKDYVLLSEQGTLPPPSLSMTPLQEFIELPLIHGRLSLELQAPPLDAYLVRLLKATRKRWHVTMMVPTSTAWSQDPPKAGIYVSSIIAELARPFYCTKIYMGQAPSAL